MMLKKNGERNGLGMMNGGLMMPPGIDEDVGIEDMGIDEDV